MPQPPVSSYFIRQAYDTRKPCRNIRSNKQRSRTSFLLPLVASINRSISRLVRCFRSLSPRQCFPLCARVSFCREFSLCDAPETRVNRGGDFSTMNKRDHFVECFGGTVVLPVFKREICNTRKPMNAQMSQSNRHEVARAGRRVSQGVILRKPTPTRCPIFHPNTPSPIASILPTTSWPGTRVGESYWKSVAPDARDLRYSKGRPDHGISDRDKKHQPKKNYGIPTSIYSRGDRHWWKRRTR